MNADPGLALADARSLAERFALGSASPREVLEAQLSRVERLDPLVRAWIAVDAPGARSAADAAALRADLGARGSVAGLTVGVKDLFDVRGLATTGGSRAYGESPAGEDAAVVARLRRAGAVLVGKLNTEELAFGVITAPTRNPWRPECIPGGSSGGPAAALAAGMVTLALGTDTGGSIRVPAALCGVVGLKPTFGRVSLRGVMPLSYSYDHAGPMARDVESVRVLFAAIDGPDPDDAGSLPALPEPGPEHRRLAVPWSWFAGEAAPDVLAVFRGALDALEGLGFTLVAVDWPSPDVFMSLQVAIRGPETYLIHAAAIAERKERFGPGLVERILAGRDATAVAYVAAQRERHRLTRSLERAMADSAVDGAVLPTTPVTAPRVGAVDVRLGDGRRVSVRDALLRYTAPFNVTGWPALSLPAGLDGGGLPVGVQLVGRRFEDERLLERARALAAALPAVAYPDPGTGAVGGD